MQIVNINLVELICNLLRLTVLPSGARLDTCLWILAGVSKQRKSERTLQVLFRFGCWLTSPALSGLLSKHEAENEQIAVIFLQGSNLQESIESHTEEIQALGSTRFLKIYPRGFPA